jgi:hypothetical protein
MKSILPLLMLVTAASFAQSEKGTVINKTTGAPVPYAKIGIPGKGIGTVADENGFFSLVINDKYIKDSIRFSCVGFTAYSVSVSDYKHLPQKTIQLSEKTIAAENVSIPAGYKLHKMGNAGNRGFIEINGGIAGSEAGVLFNFKSKSFLHKLILGIDTSTVDTIFFRVNVYKQTGEKSFKSLLDKPVYFKKANGHIAEQNLEIDLSGENIALSGNNLITIEQLKVFNKGKLRLNGTGEGVTYGRKTSFGTWRIIPSAISLQAEVYSKP